MQEAKGLLELLDKDIVRLEQQEESDDLLLEIFRASHTLKGSSGMLGLEAMAHLIHAMEDLLDRVRKKTLAVSSAIVNALRVSLGGLKILCDDISAEDETQVDVGPIVEALRAAAAGGAAPARDIYCTRAGLGGRRRRGLDRVLYLLTVHIRQETDWAAVRCFQIMNSLDRAGEVIVSILSQGDIEAERVGRTFEALVATACSVAELTATPG